MDYKTGKFQDTIIRILIFNAFSIINNSYNNYPFKIGLKINSGFLVTSFKEFLKLYLRSISNYI